MAALRYVPMVRCGVHYCALAGLWLLAANGEPQTVSTSRGLSRALANAAPGDTVFVEPGRYIDRESTWQRAFNPARSGTAAKPIVIRSKRLHAATVRSRTNSVPAIGIQNRAHIYIEGFTIEGGVGVKEGADSCIIRWCDVRDGFIQGGDVSLHWGIYISGNTCGCVIEHNHIHDMAPIGNKSHNGACVMIHHGASKNLIRHNSADGGGYMFAAFGQKGGQTNDNRFLYNSARRCQTGFFGTGSTDRQRFSERNTYKHNVVAQCPTFLAVSHNCRQFTVRNNTAWRVHTFFYGGYHAGKKQNSGFRFTHNVADTVMYKQNHSRPAPWSFLLNESNFNLIPGPAGIWHEGTESLMLGVWKMITGFDSCSAMLRAAFADPERGDWQIVNKEAIARALSCTASASDAEQAVMAGARPDSNTGIGFSWSDF